MPRKMLVHSDTDVLQSLRRTVSRQSDTDVLQSLRRKVPVHSDTDILIEN